MAILVTLAHQHSGSTLVLLMRFHLVVIPWVTTWVGTPNKEVTPDKCQCFGVRSDEAAQIQ